MTKVTEHINGQHRVTCFALGYFGLMVNRPIIIIIISIPTKSTNTEKQLTQRYRL